MPNRFRIRFRGRFGSLSSEMSQDAPLGGAETRSADDKPRRGFFRGRRRRKFAIVSPDTLRPKPAAFKGGHVLCARQESHQPAAALAM